MKNLLLACTILFAGNVNAGIIGVWGGNFSHWNSYLTTSGHTAVSVDSGSSAAQLAALDQVWLIRQNGNSNLVDYVGNGGTLVTEWSGANWALNTASLIDANADRLGFINTNTQITFTQTGIDLNLGDNVGNPYANGGSTEFFYSFNNLGVDVDVVASITGYDVGVTGAYGAGNVLALGWDWQDAGAGNLTTQNLVTDISNVSFAPENVPEPASIALLTLGLAGIGFSRKKKTT